MIINERIWVKIFKFLIEFQNMKIEKIIGFVITLIVIAYIGIILFIEMVIRLWELNPLTSIGFVISVAIAIWKGHISITKEIIEDNLSILLFIFIGTVISYAATSQIPSVLGLVFGGDLIGAVIMGIVIFAIWFRGQEIKNLSKKN